MSKLVAIDGNSIMNRAFYGIMNSKMLMTSDGTYTNAIYGFMSILLKIINEEKPDYISVAFDLKAPTFRHKKYDGYKATRKGMPDELRMQMPIIKDILSKMNIKIFEIEGYEADDILGTLSKYGENNNIDVLLLTGDRDALQLTSDMVTVRIPTTKMGKTESTDYTPEIIKEKFGIIPSEFIQTKALMGDTSDNIPGVPGVGEKTAFSLITKFHDIDNIYSKLEEGEELEGVSAKLKEKLITNKELAYLSKELGTIYREVPLEFNLEDISIKEYDPSLFDILAKLQLKTFIEKLGLSSTLTPDTTNHYDDKIIYGDFSKLDLTAVKEIAYYFDSNTKVLSLYVENKSYIIENPSNEALLTVFENDILKIGFEEKEDYLFLKKKGILARNMMFDISIASYLLNTSKSNYKLDDIILENLNVLVEKRVEQTQLTLDGFGIDESKNNDVNAKYAKYIFECKKKLENELKEKNEYNLFINIEMPLMRVLAEMEFAGVLVDKKMLEEYAVKLNNQIDILSKDITKLAGEEFNINSPKKLSEILFDKLKLSTGKKTKSGYSTDSDVLEKLVDEHPIVQKVLDYRTLNKLKATYIDGMLPLIDSENGRIHAKFNQTVTATGRISCTDPNLQNIPIRTELGKELRKAFIARDGFILIDADYSQVELRVLAHISGDKNMINAFNNGIDIHAVTASQVFNVPLDDVTKQMRSEAKAVNFGIVYGISDFGLATNINSSVKKAKDYIEKYFETYPNIKIYMDNTVNKCKEIGYVETLWGRRRYVPEINSSNYNIRQFGERVAKNAPIQGTAADIIKIAMVNVQKEIEEKKLESKLIIQVHDELLIEAKCEEADIVKELLIRNMQNVTKLAVNLEVDVNTGKTWYEAH